MLPEERRSQLLKRTQDRRFASLPELTEWLDVSESTVRRDLDWLEEQGQVKRTHGGVQYIGDETDRSPRFAAWGGGFVPEKQAIATEAARRIEDGDAILLDGGSTTYEVAKRLQGRSLHLVTTSLPVANLFAADPKCDLVFVGGSVCPRSGVVRGPLTNDVLDGLHVRRAILSTAGITSEGLFNNDPLLVETERRMMKIADEIVIVADASKFGRKSLTHVCSLNAVNRIVTDSRVGDDWHREIREAGVELDIAR